MNQETYASLLGQKLSVLTLVYENIQVDEGNVEECLRAIGSNESYFKELLEIESNLEQIPPEVSAEISGILEKIYSLLVKVKDGTLRLNKAIQDERVIVSKTIEQFSKRRDVANSYIKPDQRSVFVNKDFR